MRALGLVRGELGGTPELSSCFRGAAELGQEVAADARQQVVVAQRGNVEQSVVTASSVAGPSAMDTATARFSSTIGEWVNATRSPYREAMRTQSVSSARGALAWQAAIFAWIA
jgi:hypothetical protein